MYVSFSPRICTLELKTTNAISFAIRNSYAVHACSKRFLRLKMRTCCFLLALLSLFLLPYDSGQQNITLSQVSTVWESVVHRVINLSLSLSLWIQNATLLANSSHALFNHLKPEALVLGNPRSTRTRFRFRFNRRRKQKKQMNNKRKAGIKQKPNKRTN